MKINLINYGFSSVVRIRNNKQKILASYSFFNNDELIDDSGRVVSFNAKAKRFYEECLIANSLNEIKEIAKKYT